MKINFIDDNYFVLFINQDYLKYLKIEKDFEVDLFFKKILIRINKFYNIDIYGYFIVNVFIDLNYGIIIEFDKIASSFDLKKIELKVLYSNPIFLYKITNFLRLDVDFKNKTELLIYDSNIYIKLNDSVSIKDKLYLFENSKIIYKDTKKIIDNAYYLN